MKLLLAIDTSTEQLAVGLGELSDIGFRTLATVDLDVPRASLTHLSPAVSQVAADAGVRIADLGAVVVGRGPGSFTGVRIGVSAAKGLAHGLGVPLYGVGTLDVIAERFADHDGLLAVVGDAMRKEVYPALFRCGRGGVVRLTGDAVGRPDEVARAWASDTEGQLVLTGNGLRRYAGVFTEALGARAVLAEERSWVPTGEALVAATWRALAERRAGDGDPGTVLPVYTRLSDAEEAERDRAGAAPGVPASGVTGPVTP